MPRIYTGTYTVEVQNSDDGESWQPAAPAQTITVTDDERLRAWQVSKPIGGSQTVAPTDAFWRVCVWNGSEADHHTEPASIYYSPEIDGRTQVRLAIMFKGGYPDEYDIEAILDDMEALGISDLDSPEMSSLINRHGPGREHRLDKMVPDATDDDSILYVTIQVPLPDRIAERLPCHRDARPHITVVGPTRITEEQAHEIHDALDRGEIGAPGRAAIGGLEVLQSDDTPTSMVLLAVDGGERLGQISSEIHGRIGLPRQSVPCRLRVDLAHKATHAEIGAIAAEYRSFNEVFEVTDLKVRFGIGSATDPSRITWYPSQTYPIA